MVTKNPPESTMSASTGRRPALNILRIREHITGWLFVLPAVVIIAIFGIFPIGYAFFMSSFKWIILPSENYCLPGIDLREIPFQSLDFGTEILPNLDLSGCLTNYLVQFGNWSGLLLFLAGFSFVFVNMWAWGHIKQRLHPIKRKYASSDGDQTASPLSRALLIVGIVLMILGLVGYGVSLIGSDRLFGVDRSLEGVFLILAGGLQTLFCLWALAATRIPGFSRLDSLAGSTANPENRTSMIGNALVTLVILFFGAFIIATGWSEMMVEGNQRFLQGIIYTFYYAAGSVPIQLGLGLVLAYILYQNIRGKELYRMLFFLPYITPAVAAAVVFRIVFSPRPASLANQFLEAVGLQSQSWLQEPEPFLNAFFGLNLEGFLAGPSMALVSIMLLGIWTYTGYNAVIFLAGLGQIPGDLYEAARVDGANEWHLFRHITLPMISPITFYLSVLAFIGTFKAFNSIYVMRSPNALGTVDTASIVVFDTFRLSSRYGEATAQAILLLFIILAITQFQRSVLEKRVFYG